MNIIKTTSELSKFCTHASKFDYLTVDTEFLRERTYYPKLCLIQLAFPSDQEDNAVLVDPLDNQLDLSPLYELFLNSNVVKVFHAARQDLEIFFHDKNIIPNPLFDTQLAAMVCGFGEQVGYETLVRSICKVNLDKSSRFTDWSLRPLSDSQKDYALADVTHLRQIYEYLKSELKQNKREDWVQEELNILKNPETYITRPNEAWKRIKIRSNSSKFLGIVSKLAEFREKYAQQNDIPRNRVFKDDALMEIASLKPKSFDELSRSRLLLRDARKGRIASGILDSVKAAQVSNFEEVNKEVKIAKNLNGNSALSEMLRVLLKAKSEELGVAAKLIAISADLDSLASGERTVPALLGWRHKVFGKDALDLCDGKVGLFLDGKNIKTFKI
ncbi:ribonuclease D [Paracoccaceae bacterium]|nr:ribonuclease D [Paracoccaceae bacterium]MDB3860484.1 ribonuclease D [Paracoccaceae bacterium]